MPPITLSFLCGYTGGWHWPANDITHINSSVLNVIFASDFITLN